MVMSSKILNKKSDDKNENGGNGGGENDGNQTLLSGMNKVTTFIRLSLKFLFLT